MKGMSKDIMNKIIDVKLANRAGKDNLGPGAYVVLKRHVKKDGTVNPKSRVGRIEIVDGDKAKVFFRYHDAKKGTSRVREVPVGSLHKVSTTQAHKIHKAMYKIGLPVPAKVTTPKDPTPEPGKGAIEPGKGAKVDTPKGSEVEAPAGDDAGGGKPEE